MSTLPTIFNSSNTKIFSTNEQNIVEANKDNIVEADAQIREVIPKGYLLSNINLSTVPDVIADAILQAMSDTKDAVLSDSLLSTLRTSLENLDDGVYKKTYIDNTITYLENLLTSKVDAETVASIADSKIATASEGFAATSSVNLLTSRVDSSESAIITLAETVNTKDTARANQISELKASIDDTFSGYSEAIDLVVESDGSVRAKKIEDLRVEFESEIGLVNASIADTNELIVEKDGEWKASSMKLITNPYGGITGYSFQDGSGLKSNFTINADTFKISNSTNTYIPFSIVDNNITFNGKVSFSNTTTSTGATLIDVLDDLQNDLTNLLNENNTAALLEIANLDGKIDDKEQELINSINAEASTRATQITARINAEALLDGKIDAEETARINAATALETALKNYTDVVADALIDGEISAAEQNAINEAQTRVNTAKTQLETMINNLTKVEDISWQSEVQAAIDNNLTTIDGGKIVTNEAFVNNLNAVGGIVASEISADDFYGKNFYGGYFEGALIVGSVIKASYLDLDGELEVLTNYHISVATRNANPSLYTDAIYVSGTNEYRIPSISSLIEYAPTKTLSSVGSSTGRISAYNIANVGNNYKAVKANPVFQNSSSTILSANILSGVYPASTFVAYLRLGTTILGTISVYNFAKYNLATASVSFSSNYTSSGNITHNYVHNNTLTATHTYVPTGTTSTKSNSIDISGIPVFGSIKIALITNCYHYPSSGGSEDYTTDGLTFVNSSLLISTNSYSSTLPFSWNDTSKINIYVASPNTVAINGYCQVSGIVINNMA